MSLRKDIATCKERGRGRARERKEVNTRQGQGEAVKQTNKQTPVMTKLSTSSAQKTFRPAITRNAVVTVFKLLKILRKGYTELRPCAFPYSCSDVFPHRLTFIANVARADLNRKSGRLLMSSVKKRSQNGQRFECERLSRFRCAAFECVLTGQSSGLCPRKTFFFYRGP